MSLTRITSGVVSSNAISAEKLANSSIDSRQIANTAIELRHLASSANTVANLNSIQANINATTANINIVQANVNSQRSNVNTVSSNIATGDANSVAFTANVEARRTANIAGAISSVLTSDLTASRALVSGSGGKIEVSAVTSTEIGHLDGVTGAIQTQLDGKQATITGSASTIDTESLTADRAVISNGSQKIAVSDVTSTELGYLDGVTYAIQTQLDAKAALAGATFSGQVNMNDDLVVTGNLIVSGDTTTANTVNMVIQDRMLMLANSATGAPGSDVGILFNRGNQGNAAFFYDESASTFKLSDTKDPSSNTLLSPVTSSNLDVGIVTAATLNATAITQNGATLDNLIGSNVDGAISTVNDTDLTASRALASSGSGKIEVSAVTATELGHLDGVTSAIQTQLDAKQATITGAATTIDDADLTVSRALGSSGSGKVAVSDVTSTELGHLDGVTSAVQTQIDGLTTNINTLDSNADANFTQLNANINVVSGNAAIGLKQLTNVISSTGANTFHVATPPGSTNPTTISNVQVFIDGLAQKPKTSSSDNDYIYTSGSGLVTVTDASLPSGLTVQITALYPPS